MDFQICKQQMQNVIDFFHKELSGIQLWRATKELVNHINVQADYGIMPIWQLANIVIPDNQTIKIEPRDKKILKPIEKAIYESNNWLTPNNEWDVIRVRIPPLTQERKNEVIKQIHSMWEDCKKSLRQTRHDYTKHLKKDFESDEISEDEKKIWEKNVDELIKEFTSKIDNIVKTKEEKL